MSSVENIFDINRVLLTLFSSLTVIRDEKKIDLIYEMNKTMPKELRGNAVVLLQLLTKMLTFVFKNTNRKEIVLSLDAPEDFLYEEFISFKIKETNIVKEKILDFLETELSNDLKILNGKVVYKNDNTSDIQLDILFKINELGYRRHYRLPNRSMLNKKVLLICQSEKMTRSIKKMFKYFLYDVDVGADEYKRCGSDLTQYNIFIIEDQLVTEKLEALVLKVQKNTPLKYVLLHDSNYVSTKNALIEATHLIKPVMQESIFELIVSLFNDKTKNREIRLEEKKNTVDLEKVAKMQRRNLNQENKESNLSQNSLENNSFQTMLKKKKETNEPILNDELGKHNKRKTGLEYSKELKLFLYSFDHSDVYFREIVNEKAINKIKEFCIDLEKQAKSIGAQSMSKFANDISLLFVYDKLDVLSTYPGRYHIELQKLIKEIKHYLHI